MKQFIFVLSFLFLFACTPQTYDKPNYDLVGNWTVEGVSPNNGKEPIDGITVVFDKNTFQFTGPDNTPIFRGEYVFYGHNFVYKKSGEPRIDGCFVVYEGKKITITEPRYNNGTLRKIFDILPQEQANIHLSRLTYSHD